MESLRMEKTQNKEVNPPNISRCISPRGVLQMLLGEHSADDHGLQSDSADCPALSGSPTKQKDIQQAK